MATEKPITPSPNSRENQISAVRKQLLSPLPSDIKRGLDQLRQWLKDNTEDREIYKLIIDATKDNASLQDQIYSLLENMVDKGSSLAAEALNDLNNLTTTQVDNFEDIAKQNIIETQLSGEQGLMSQADDDYYAAEYDKAILLYQQILRREPNNLRARQQLEKATLNRMASIPFSSSSNLPREAVQYYRQARSYIAAKDFNSAIEYLKIALEKAQTYGKRFLEAEAFLEIIQDQITAAEHKISADNAILDEKWEGAISAFNIAHNYDPSDDSVNKMRDALQSLLKAEALLDPFGMQISTERGHKLAVIASALKETEEVKELVNTKRYKAILAKYSLYNAETDLHKWGYLTALAPQGKLKETQDAAKSILNSDDAALKYIEAQARRFRPIRMLTFASLALILGFVIFIILNMTDADDTSQSAISKIATPSTPSLTMTLQPSITPSPTATNILSATPTATATQSPTLSNIGVGYVNLLRINARETPNGKSVGILTKPQVVTILDQRTVSQDKWFFCQWEIDGIIQKGWILATYITLGPTPTPRPTYSP